MRIKSLASTADRTGRFKVVLEDDSVLRLYRQTVQDFCLYPGAELSDEQLSQLQTAAGEMSAKMRAMRIVSASNVSKSDLQHRLIQKGETPEQAKAAVKWMSDLSLVDDAKTAELIVSRCIAKGYGLARAKQALYEKRVPKALWAEALADYPEQIDKIMDFLESRLDGNASNKDVKRAIDALLRRGHSYGAVRTALSQMSLDSDEFQED